MFDWVVAYSWRQHGFETAVQNFVKMLSVDFFAFCCKNNANQSLLSFLCWQPCSRLRKWPQHPHGVQLQHTVPHTHPWSLQGHTGRTLLLLLLQRLLFSLLRCHREVTQAFCLHTHAVIFAVHAWCQDQDVHTCMTYWKPEVRVTNTGGKTH